MRSNQIIADLHLHSKFSRAVSQDMIIPQMSHYTAHKGIDLLATGDWMHPVWMAELQANLQEWSDGIYQSQDNPDGAKFLLATEISNIYSQDGQTRRVHILVWAPNFDTALKINAELRKHGCNLSSDGRPIVGLTCIELAELVFSVNDQCLVIPAHAWTPWFSLYGSKSGFDSIDECFGQFADRIYAIETGLSSDPAMNWRIKELDKRAIISFSDAHSLPKLGREVTVFSYQEKEPSDKKFNYQDIYWAIAERFTGKNQGNLKIAYTIEFYPQEGKYHWDGHRHCNVIHSPEDTRQKGIQCPVCGRPLTVGVEYRVDQLAQKDLVKLSGIKKENNHGVTGYFHPHDNTRPPYLMLVPLLEILAEVKNTGANTKTVKNEYNRLVDHFGGEFKILTEIEAEKLRLFAGERFATAITKVRKGDIVINPGYDGVFGTVKIWPEDKQPATRNTEQMGLF